MSTCATLSRELSEPLAATAATATTWLLVEQTGPWGAKALGQSHLDPEVGRALDAATGGTGVRVALIRRPGRHADCLPTARHEVVVAHTVPTPGRSWVRRGAVADPAELLALDFTALGAGEHGGFGTPHRRPDRPGVHQRPPRPLLRLLGRPSRPSWPPPGTARCGR